MTSDRKFNCDLGGCDGVLWGTLVVDLAYNPTPESTLLFAFVLHWPPPTSPTPHPHDL
jgi:hypothetical protein